MAPTALSLIHIYIGFREPESGNLTRWAQNGVLLLNSVLTVRAGIAGSHAGMGWETLTDKIIALLGEREKPIVFLLWGGYARRKAALIPKGRHLILEAAHPLSLIHIFASESYQRLRAFLKQEYSTRRIYPHMNDIFNALRYTDYDDVRAVILGQDPYHGPGQAHGLCFSVQDGVAKPPSLVNIFKEDVYKRQRHSCSNSAFLRTAMYVLYRAAQPSFSISSVGSM